MTLDEMLGQRAGQIAAWDDRWPDKLVLHVYATSVFGARLVHTEEVPSAQRDAVATKVLSSGARLGGAYSYTGHVWVLDDLGIGVWTSNARLVEGSATKIGLHGGTVNARDVKEVKTFVDPSDPSHRGVRCKLVSGVKAVFAEEHHEGAKADPFCNTDSLLEDMRWAILLGQDLAVWLGVPHVDQDGDVTNRRHLSIARESHSLADAIVSLPETGEFAHVIHVIGTFEPYGRLQYRYAPNPRNLARRFLELRLFTPSGKSSWARWVAQGTNGQVVAFLRQVRTPRTIIQHMDAMAIKLAREQYV